MNRAVVTPQAPNMIPRPARLIAALFLSGIVTAHSQSLHRGNASGGQAGDVLDDPVRGIHLICRSVVDGRLVGSDWQSEKSSEQAEAIPEVPERITGGRYRDTLTAESRTGVNLPFEGLSEFLWVRTGGGNGGFKPFAAAQREAARAFEADCDSGRKLLTWPTEMVAFADGVGPFGDDSWDFQIQEVPEPSSMILITMGCGLMLTRRRVCR